MSVATPDGLTLITGGAGFIGTNLADRLLSQGRRVLVLDNLSRPGVERNVHWLQQQHPGRVQLEVADLRDADAVRTAARRATAVFHFAAQATVPTGLDSPVHDFEINARGTLTLLEALRSMRRPPPLLYSSTSKVYGALDEVALAREGTRYAPVDPAMRANGLDETRSLDFHGPHGCAKGAADQYVLDYARSYGLRTIVFRMSCIYGPHQFGNEDQGWVTHFLTRARAHRELTLFGDGLQVRDVLYVDDLVDACERALRDIDTLAGQAFNIGGGPANALSLIELLALLRSQYGLEARTRFAPWRSGDPRWFVADTHRFSRATGWTPRIGVAEGIARLDAWLDSEEEEELGEESTGYRLPAGVLRGSPQSTVHRLQSR